MMMNKETQMTNPVQSAYDFIVSNADESDLCAIISAVKLRQAHLAHRMLRAVRVGDKVQFTTRGTLVKGTAIKIGRKKIKVEENKSDVSFIKRAVIWNVPANMLSFSEF